jgi:hypothetical protein
MVEQVAAAASFAKTLCIWFMRAPGTGFFALLQQLYDAHVERAQMRFVPIKTPARLTERRIFMPPYIW